MGRPLNSADARLYRCRARAAAYRGDRGDGREVRSVRFLLVGLLAGLHEVEAVLDLAEHAREILLLLQRETGHDLVLPAQQARNELLVQRFSLSRHAQPKLAAVVFILDPFHELAR